MSTGTIQVRTQRLSSDELRTEYAQISAARPIISDAAALTIATWWQKPSAESTAVDAQLAAFATGSPVDAGELLQDVLAAYATADNVADQQELIALALWTAKHSTGYTVPRETCGHGTWLDSCHEPHGQIRGSLPSSRT